MKNIRFLKEHKLIIIVIIIAMAAFSWVYSLLPNFYITGSRVEWKGRTYKECRAESRWVLGKCIAKDVSGQRLYALKGDKYKKYHRNLLGGLYRENPVKSRNYEAVKSSKKWENVGNSYIIPALLLYRYSYI